MDIVHKSQLPQLFTNHKWQMKPTQFGLNAETQRRRGHLISASLYLCVKKTAWMLFAGLCLATTAVNAADTLTMADFAYTNKLMVSGYTGESTLQNFPVLVRLAEYDESSGTGIEGFLYANLTNSKGKDIAFFDEAGNHLASEIETNSWKNVNNESLIWVRLPEMKQGTRFYMCYNTSASGAWVTNENPWGDYVGVWHMDESGNQTNNRFVYDATTNALNGKIYGTNDKVSRNKNGMVGAARRMAVDKNHEYAIVVAATNGTQKAAADSLGTDFTASFWMNPQGSDFTYGFLVDRRKGEYNNPGGWGTRLHNGTKLQVYAATEKPNSGNYDGTLTKQPYTELNTADTWSKVDIHWYATSATAGAADIYVNGAKVETLTLPKPPLQTDSNIGIGGSTQDNPTNTNPTKEQKGRRFNGYMDEVRLRCGGLSADWIKADYDTVNNVNFITKAPPDELTVRWANASSDAPGVSAVTHSAVTFAGTVLTVGDTASSCEIQYKVWADGASEPGEWTSLTNGLVSTEAFAVAVSGLAVSTSYQYVLRAVGNDGAETDPVSGAFTTDAGLSIAWSAASGTAGFSGIAYDFATVGGTVSSLGDASSCAILGKVWADGEEEPSSWTVYASGLAAGDGFTHNVVGLSPGTAYSYKLYAHGNDDSEAAVVSGTFTTQGSTEEEIGSPYTHFFEDGTNAFWVVNDFERYLPFTVTGYTGTEVLTNFPVLVEVRKADYDTNGFTYDDFYHYDGADLAFVDEKGHIIPHEIDTWNKNGQSLFWVRLPEMVNGTKFTMCYRSPLVYTDENPAPPDPGCVFEKYVGVWHMAEAGDGVVNLKDSGPYGFETETHAMSLDSGLSGGRIGRARRVAQQNGSAGSYGRIIAFDHDDILRTGVGNVFTYSGWYKLMQAQPKWAYLVGRKSEDGDIGWGVQYDDTATDKLRVWPAVGKKQGFQTFSTPGAGGNGVWNYWTFIFDGSVNPDGTTNRIFHAYLNGEELASTRGGFQLDFDVVNDERAAYDHLCVVGQQNGTGAFNGLADECRYSRGYRSDDWIKAEYASTLQQQYWNDPARRFVTKGDQVSHGVDSLVPVVVWERGTGLPDTILDVSYAYVQFAGTVTYCGAGADECSIQYQIWPDGEERPEEWEWLREGLRSGDAFSVPVTGLKQDMLYNFRIRAVNVVDGQERQNHEHVGQFRTTGNLSLGEYEGEMFRLGDKFVHRYAEVGNWRFTTPDYVTNVEILVVGGGGAGGYKVGGGGGGGGLFYSESFPVATGTVYRIHVGKGGIAPSNTTTTAASGNGEQSYFALEADTETPLIRVPGGGGGGSYTAAEAVSTGATGGSGGGGTYAQLGGMPVTNMIVKGEEPMTVGHKGGRGNDKMAGGALGMNAAGGGGGAGRAATGATFDQRSTGGSGGVGIACDMTGETLYYGAGGGGGYIYHVFDESNWTRPGTGGSGIGGDAANIREGTPATSGVPNTGAGGGGGSSLEGNSDGTTPSDDSTYWQGGNGGNGVVLISYEAHGRDPISEEPRITMLTCDYTDEKGYADIHYRAYWAGIQSQYNDIYVLYSTVSEEDVMAGNGEMVKVADHNIAISDTVFTPPEVGYTYYVRLVARKDANSFMYSDEVANFYVPAIRNNGANWHMPACNDDDPDNDSDTSRDYASIMYALYDLDPEARLYLYWSENADDVNGDTAPSGEGIHFLDLGVGMQSKDGTVNVPASEGFERDKIYYTRLATGNEAGTKYFLSPRTMVLETRDKPRVIFPEATWSNHVATVEFLETTSHLDPQTVDLIAYYGTLKEVYGDNGDVNKMNAAIKSGTKSVNLGKCFLYPDDMETTTQFPLWSPVDTNYYVRLALETNGVIVAVSQRYQYLTLISAVPANTLLVYVNETPHVSCYGDDPATPSYNVSYGGYTEGPGWDHWTNAMRVVGTPYCPVTKDSPSGQYDITQGTLTLSSLEPYWREEPVLDEETGEPLYEGDDPVTQRVPYYYMLCFTSSRHIVTNAIFSASIADISVPYTGEPCDTSALVVTTNGIINAQPVSYQYRAGTNAWTSAIPSGYTDVGAHTVQFKATAPNHDDAEGTFKVTVEPAPLSAVISAGDTTYTGDEIVPEVVTNVTGVIKPEVNALTCQFRDDASEWLPEVPAFIAPGTYTLWFRVSAPNHTTFVTNCTFMIEGWDYWVNMDNAEGYRTEIRVSDPSWLLDVTGWDGDRFSNRLNRYAKLDETCANGLKLWHNYLISRTDLGKRLVATIRQSGDRVNENAFVVHFPGVEVLRNAGLAVSYRLDRKLRGTMGPSEFAAADFVQGEPSDKYEMNVPLGPDDPTGLYIFNIVLSPTNALDSGSAVLASVTTVGVLRVSSAITNTVAATPWLSMSVDSTNETEVSVADVVNPSSTGAGDQILSYDPATGDFSTWELADDGRWNAIPTVSTRGVSESAAETTQFAPGKAFWLVREAPGDYIYLIGRYTGEDYVTEIAGGTAESPVSSLIANPTMFDIDLNDLEFIDGEGHGATPADGDLIVTQNLSGLQTIYSRKNGEWGRNVSTKVNGRIKSVWTPGGTIPSGTGFWYSRTSDETLRIKFSAVK